MKGAVADELIVANPVAGVERPKPTRQRWRILEPPDVPRLCKAFSDDRARRVFLCFILTGLRRSELVALRWGHVNLVEQTLRVIESKSEEGERLIALPRSLATELDATTQRRGTDPTTTTCSHTRQRAPGWTANGSGSSSRKHARQPGSRAGSESTTCVTRR